jgi:hypothetical protein
MRSDSAMAVHSSGVSAPTLLIRRAYLRIVNPCPTKILVASAERM